GLGGSRSGPRPPPLRNRIEGELWFNTLQRRCLRMADFASGDDVAAKILAFIDTYNRLHAHPYRWTYTGEALAA
ncbi:MAG TPA: hypothetical protein VKI99_18615, partial [Candidatus Dormibacteraeota bacterium]|nr:hypothetical protein [Candidatus Dormibacteraeota bacterium]